MASRTAADFARSKRLLSAREGFKPGTSSPAPLAAVSTVYSKSFGVADPQADIARDLNKPTASTHQFCSGGPISQFLADFGRELDLHPALIYPGLEGQPNMATANTFGNWLRAVRQLREMTQRDLAQAVSIDFTYLSKLENGKDQPPSDQVIAKMAKVLNVPADYLFAVAGRVPPDVRERAEQNPRFALLLRRLGTLPDRELARHYDLAGVATVSNPEEVVGKSTLKAARAQTTR